MTILAGTPGKRGKEEYLRIHVRAHSNAAEDQEVKYAVRDEVVRYLTPVVAECESKKALQNALQSRTSELERIADGVLAARGFPYRSRAEIRTEEFPVRVYGDLTLEEGYYDALILELGSGAGDNWWCVVYPPLCFIGEDGGDGFRYRSRIVEIIGKWKERYGR